MLDDARDGPLPVLFLALTAVAGALNAISYLRLDHTFVANMTGNIMFVGFALVGAPGVSLGSSLLALAAFAVGAFGGGSLITKYGSHRGQLLVAALLVQLLLVGAALVLVLAARLDGIALDVVIAALAAAMGIQSAATRRIALIDLPTVVLTSTVSALASDTFANLSNRQRTVRRVGTVTAMLAGAIASAALCIYAGTGAALGVTFVVLLVTAMAALRVSKTSATWIAPV